MKRRLEVQKLSHSRTQTRRDCEAKYGYRYVDLLRLRVEKDPTRIRGRGLHSGLKAGYEAWRDLRTARYVDLTSSGVAKSTVCIVEAALAAELEAHTDALEQLEIARESGADVSTCDEVLANLIDGHEADSWALRHFFEVTAARDFARKIPILIEHPFDVPVRDAIGRAHQHLRWIGQIDLLMYDEPTRMLELHESKTVSSNAGSEEHRRRIEGDPQTTSYVYALRELRRQAPILFGPYVEAPIGQVIVDVIRRKKAPEPKVLADGTVSTDSRIDTLPQIYEAALEVQEQPEYLTNAFRAEAQARAELAMLTEEKAIERVQKRATKLTDAYEKKSAKWDATQAKQRELLERLRQRGDTFVHQFEHFVDEPELERWRAEQWVEAERMRRIERRPAERTRNLGFCTAPGRGCTYRTLCYSGGDPQVREMEFTTPAERERMAAEAEAKASIEAAKPEAAPAWG